MRTSTKLVKYCLKDNIALSIKGDFIIPLKQAEIRYMHELRFSFFPLVVVSKIEDSTERFSKGKVGKTMASFGQQINMLHFLIVFKKYINTFYSFGVKLLSCIV